MQRFLKENNFVWKTDLAGHYTYAPLGKQIQNQNR